MKKFAAVLILAAACTGQTPLTQEVPGPQGPQGDAGTPAAPITVYTTPAPADACGPNGGTEVFFYTDANNNHLIDLDDHYMTSYVTCNGTNGSAGAQGIPGRDGTSCTVTTIAPDSSPDSATPYGGALIACGDSQVFVSNGAPGAVGADGQPGAPAPSNSFSVVEVIDPCGKQGSVSEPDEVLLQLQNGTVLGAFQDSPGNSGNAFNVRLSYLADGQGFRTTDETGCVFSLATAGHTRTLSWTAKQGNIGFDAWTIP